MNTFTMPFLELTLSNSTQFILGMLTTIILISFVVFLANRFYAKK